MENGLPQNFSKLHLPPVSKANKVNMVEIVLLVVIIVLFYWFMVGPKRKETNEQNIKQQKLENELRSAESQKSDLQTLINSMDKNPDDIAKLDEALPFEGKLTVMYLLVDKFVSESGVLVNNVSFGNETEGPVAGNRELLSDPYKPARSLKRIPGNISVKGTLDQVQNFLQKLESSGRIFDVFNFQLVPGLDGEVVMSLSTNSYFYAP